MTDLQNPGQSLNVKKVTSILLDDVFPASNGARLKIQRSVIFSVTLDNDLARVKENVRKIQDGGISVTVVVVGDANKQRLSIIRNDLLSIVGDAKKIIFLDSESTESVADKVDDSIQLVNFPSKFFLLLITCIDFKMFENDQNFN